MSEAKPPRGEQLKRLRALRLQPAGDVRASVLKAVLRCIDDHGAQCWASAATIADETQFSVRSVMRAIGRLVERGYLVEEKRSGQTSVHSVNWTHADLCQAVRGEGQAEPMPASHPPMPGSHPPMPASHLPMPGCHTKRNKRKEASKKRNTSPLRFDDGDFVFATEMFSSVQKVAPKTPKPDLDKWANTIRLMRESDRHTLEEIGAVFKWANADDFWKTNILSADSLRKKFATLHARMVNPVTFGKPRTANVGAGVNYDSSKEFKW